LFLSVTKIEENVISLIKSVGFFYTLIGIVKRNNFNLLKINN